ncbi:MAG: PBP1A family penicillin-binding protein [Gemmatimonadaceae bacterium]|nr:PBP1A family penicillin-binding protein [Gemmatimonadaceae bacterium]
MQNSEMVLMGTEQHEGETENTTLPRPRWRRRVAIWLGGAAIVALVAAQSWWNSCGFTGCPTVEQLRAWQPTEGGMLFDRHGAIIGALTPVKRLNVPLSRVPQSVRSAFVAVEDRRFYAHHGIDYRGFARALISNVFAGGISEGASTITMQLARNVFLSRRIFERSVNKKLVELRLATLLERALTKDEILERYLNAIYLGNGVFGVEGAARDLFGHSVDSVSVAEAAMLAALPKAPSSYTLRNNLSRAKTRRDIVLGTLAKANVFDSTQIAQALATPLLAPAREWKPKVIDSWALEVVRATIDSLRKAGAISVAVPDWQLRVRSTFDLKAQLAAERTIATGADAIDRRLEAAEAEPPKAQGAMVAMDQQTGGILALVGGRRVERGGFNRALRAQRQPGSAFKPFVYVTALKNGFTTASIVIDEPVEMIVKGERWAPANFEENYGGRLTLRDALARSANAATIRISTKIGIPLVAAQANAQGIRSELPMVPSLALGAGGVTPLEMVTAYAPFANGGNRVIPHVIDRIEDVFGTVLWKNPHTALRPVMTPQDAFLITSLMESVVNRGSAESIRDAGIKGPVAGKTGTTNDGAEVWFVGFTPTILAGVWFGADTPVPLGESATGGRLAAPAWARFIKEGWHSPATDSAWKTPAGIESVRVDITTGKLASNKCGASRLEYFRVGTAPTTSCETDPYRWIPTPDTLASAPPIVPPPDPPPPA